MFGRVEVSERIWREGTHNYLRLLPQAIGVRPRGRSARLERVLTDFGCEHSFAKAAGQVREHYGFEIPVSGVREATLKHAHRAHEKLEAKYRESYRTLPALGAERIIAEADGTMICTVTAGHRKDKRSRQWKEMRLLAAQVQGKTQTVYAATFGGVDEAGRRWGHCAKDAWRGLNSQIHALGDGAEWIRLQVTEVFGTSAQFLCDLFHISQYLGAAAPSCRPGAPDRWRRTQQERLKRGAAHKVLEQLQAYLEPEATLEEEAPVQNAHRYLFNRMDCIDYPSAIRLGLPIGSGLIESGHRHVLQARLKRAGTAWLVEHADRLASLRVLRANHLWSTLWN